MRHGLTMGELGHYFIKCDKLSIDYEVITVDNLKRTKEFSDLIKYEMGYTIARIFHAGNQLFVPSICHFRRDQCQ